MNADNTMEVFQQRFSHYQVYPSHKCNVTALEMSRYTGFQKDCMLFIYYGWEFQRDKGAEFKANKNCWLLAFFCCFFFLNTPSVTAFHFFPQKKLSFL